MATQRAFLPSLRQGPVLQGMVVSGEVVEAEMPHQGWLGVMVCAVPIEPRFMPTARQRAGLLVERTARNSPAARSGIRAADVLLLVNGTAVTYDGSLRVALAGRRFGDPLSVVMLRDGKVRNVHIVPDPA